MKSRRDMLRDLTPRPSTNAGLWLDKYLTAQTEKNKENDDATKSAKSRLVREVGESIECPDGYSAAFEKWKASFNGSPVRMGTATALGRIAIGLGDKGALEVGLTLDHTWGVPVLPGSALKGLASMTAELLADDHDQWTRPTSPDKTDAGGHHQTLFGTVEGEGAVIFHDAWWIPSGAGKKLDLHPDVMTVHHHAYYEGKAAPSDTDSPNPVAFMTTGGSYLIVVEAARPDVDPGWLGLALQLLQRGLAELGIGAKTNAGYGRMTLVIEPTVEEQQAQERAAQSARTAELAAKLTAQMDADLKLVVPGTAKDRIASFLPRYEEAGLGPVFAAKVVAKLGRKWLAAKEWARHLLALADHKPS